jgi:acetyl esterase/lipase
VPSAVEAVPTRNDRTAGFVIVVLLLCFVTMAAWSAPLDFSDIAVGAPALPQGYESPKDLQYANKRGLIQLLEMKDLKLSDDIVIEKNIAYGKAGEIVLPLDLYRPKHIEQAVPGLIFIHGGGWASGDKEFYTYWAAHSAERGYVCASIEYRKSDIAPFPAAVEDCKCAVRWMRANAAKYNINPDQIGVMGNSAGAHLAMMLAYSS